MKGLENTGKNAILTVPNIISVIRIILVGLFCGFYLGGMPQVAFFILLASGISDLLDGYIARKYNQISDFGKVLDPIADKLFQLSTIFCFWLMHKIELWILVLILVKELFMAVGGMIFYRREKTVIAAKWYGKLASALFFVSFMVVMIFSCFPVVSDSLCRRITSVLFLICLGVSFFAGGNYVLAAFDVHNQNREKKTEEHSADNNRLAG